FEYALSNHRKKVTCFTKDNILKMSDGLFHKVFDEIAKEYPTIENEHWIVDIGAAKLADTPEAFDVIVMPNLYGDILSDVAAQIAGSVGLAGSANIGAHCAMFEAIHGSAPRRAGQNLANPSGLIQAAVMMLVHIGQSGAANAIQNAWYKTLEDGIHTYDIFKPKTSKEKVGTHEFGQAIIDRLGQVPEQFKPANFGPPKHLHKQDVETVSRDKIHKKIIGVDVFVDWEGSLEKLHHKLAPLDTEKFKLEGIYNRGVQVWPKKAPETLCIDSWRCRYSTKNNHQDVLALLDLFVKADVDFTHVELLYDFG
ncbi:MAG: isocitrate/isopropylmalate family dehydrogenase, partial [Parachlamydiaceae bacterium]